MAKELLCQWCKTKSPKELMVLHVHITSKDTKKNMYFHLDCLPKYLEDKEKKAEDNQELDDLYNVIRKIHRVDILPGSFMSGYIQPMRNGTFKSGTRVKKSKQGVKYSLIKDTYLYCEQSIDYARSSKSFKNSKGEYDISLELKYCLAIVIGKIPTIKKRQQEKEAVSAIEKQISSMQQSKEDIEFAERDVKFVKKNNGKKDMSDFLD